MEESARDSPTTCNVIRLEPFTSSKSCIWSHHRCNWFVCFFCDSLPSFYHQRPRPKGDGCWPAIEAGSHWEPIRKRARLNGRVRLAGNRDAAHSSFSFIRPCIPFSCPPFIVPSLETHSASATWLADSLVVTQFYLVLTILTWWYFEPAGFHRSWCHNHQFYPFFGQFYKGYLEKENKNLPSFTEFKYWFPLIFSSLPSFTQL